MQSNTQDQNFDAFADKFEKNIYGSTKGQLRHELLLHHLQEYTLEQGKPLDILDAGGGTGVMTKALLELGHNVTLTDISGEVLELARQKLGKDSHLEILHRDILSLSTDKQYDLVLCHAVLEWIQDPIEVIKKLLASVKPGGHLSLSFFNYDAQLFGNMLYGNFDYVEQGMATKKNIVRLSPNNPQKPKVILSELDALPVNIIKRVGIRCFHDYLKQPEKQLSDYQQLKQLEIKYGSTEPYLWLGKYFLIVAQKKQTIELFSE
ncbi:methyltransferase domain-containing protein [uncultured Paraglaciecola sp.]|uniref:methyltransferase domain-containing protein n=1 Tax=uncultured Paraglaciecola sp. TaxID=1765024 RepID=UPI00260A9C19|nr:methyltransferase domain-containing protein [uncultured Paraglaciecola sp.]